MQSYKKWLAPAACVLLVVSCLGYQSYLTHQVHVAQAAAPGSVPSWETQFQSFFASVGASGGAIGVIVTLLHGLAGRLQPGGVRDGANQAVEIAAAELLARERAASKDKDVRAHLLAAGEVHWKTAFDLMNPIDPNIDGAS